MRKICIINQKGGVGKTTTAVNLGAGLSRMDRKVLLIDLDPQGNIATSFNQPAGKDLHNVIAEGADINEVIRPLGKNLDVVASRETLTKSEFMIASQEDKEFILKSKLDPIRGYDYVLLDCPPSLGVLNQNAMLFSEEAFIPVSTNFLSIDALKKMIMAIQKINEVFGHNLMVTKIIPTLYDRRNTTCRESLDFLRNEFYEFLSEPIRINSKLMEAPSKGMSIFSYDNASRGAKDYMALVKQILTDEAKIKKTLPPIKVKQ